MTRIVVVDYGSGNLRSVSKSLEHVAPDGTAIHVTADPLELAQATHVILPGVGAFADCISGLNAIPGMRNALEEHVHGYKKWFLGICVGMQMLFEWGHENGVHKGLGWLSGEVVKIVPRVESRESSKKEAFLDSRLSTLGTPLKIPHMGWNELSFSQPRHPLLNDIAEGDHAYFVHSYHARTTQASDVLATTHYGEALTAIVARDHIMGTQFHPEKSQKTGLTLLRNFLQL